MILELRERILGTQFTWAQALYQSKWGFHIFPTTIQKENIEKVALALQNIAALYDKKTIYITSWLRSEPYNKFIGGAENSKHCIGQAIDFYVDGVSCDEVRKFLEPKLEQFKIRMEDKPNSSWVHIDIAPVVFSRFFKP